MPRATITATVTATTDLKLSTTVKAMLVTRAREHAKLAKVISEAEKRQKRIKKETEELFMKEKQGKALSDGCDVDGFKFKMVCGQRSVLDKTLLVELGCEQEWLDEATTTEDNEPYIKITAPKEEKE